ncbi:MAG: hypothetical protein AB7G34_05555 [Hyphomicrobiales bacterium]
MAAGLALALLPPWAAAVAAPANLCVSCSEPAQTYICSVDSPLSNNSQALQLYCVIKLAKEGNHKSCAVSKDIEPGKCPGTVKAYRYDGPNLPGQLGSGEGNFARTPQTGTTAEDEKSGPPDTLVEAARAAPGAASRAVRNVGKGAGEKVGSAAKGAGHAAKNVGSRIGDAARCVTSLFRGCGSSSE